MKAAPSATRSSTLDFGAVDFIHDLLDQIECTTQMLDSFGAGAAAERLCRRRVVNAESRALARYCVRNVIPIPRQPIGLSLQAASSRRPTRV